MQAARNSLIPNPILGMAMFVATEIMFFVGLISSFLVIRAGASFWPPIGQPRLPVEATAFNTLVLLASAVMIYLAGKSFKIPFQANKAHRQLTIAMALGLFFVLFQGYEWVQMIGFGLTANSSLYGAIFYAIIGAHGFHVLTALIVLAYARTKIHPDRRKEMDPHLFTAIRLLWYFVVGIWPILYVLVYLV